MAHLVHRAANAPVRSFSPRTSRFGHDVAVWARMSVSWLGLPLKMAVESVLSIFLRPPTTTILDIPATPSQFPPISAIRKDLAGLGAPANDAAPAGTRQPGA